MMAKLRPILLVLSVGMVSACIATHPFYYARHLREDALTESDRSWMVITLAQEIDKGQITQLEVETPEGRYEIHPRGPGAPILDALPLPVLSTAVQALDRRMRGAEWDRIVPLDNGSQVPVTVWYELDGRMLISMGRALPETTTVPVTAEEIQARHGIGPLVSGDADWDDDQRRDLDRALSLLSPEERWVIAGIPFRRFHQAPTGVRTISAGYLTRYGQAQIQIFDLAFSTRDIAFCGETQAPLPAPVADIVHEVGHAIADAARLAIVQQASTLYKENHEAFQSVQDMLKEFADAEAEWKKVQHAWGGAQPSRLAGEMTRRIQAIQAKQDEITALGKERDALRLRYRQEEKEASVLQAYRQVRGAEKGPTPYGRTSLSESFAESFSLFRVDPAALRRVYPEVHEWFARGGHLQKMQEALGGLPLAGRHSEFRTAGSGIR